MLVRLEKVQCGAIRRGQSWWNKLEMIAEYAIYMLHLLHIYYIYIAILHILHILHTLHIYCIYVAYILHILPIYNMQLVQRHNTLGTILKPRTFAILWKICHMSTIRDELIVLHNWGGLNSHTKSWPVGPQTDKWENLNGTSFLSCL